MYLNDTGIYSAPPPKKLHFICFFVNLNNYTEKNCLMYFNEGGEKVKKKATVVQIQELNSKWLFAR